MPSLAASGIDAIKSALKDATNPGNPASVPGLVFCAVDKSGKYLAQEVAGKRGPLPNDPPMTLDTVFWIASCTKMITGIAALQLVEQGKLDLESSDSLYKVCPELKDKKVLQEDGSLVPKQKEITLRMLLDHTSGFGYSFFNEKLRDQNKPAGWDEFAGDSRDYLEMPLVNQPGSRWEYGIGIDWAGITVERVSGLTLNDYFQKHIFEPLGISGISFFPDKHMRDNLVSAVLRTPDGKYKEIDHPFRRPVMAAETQTQKGIFNSGGAGAFAKPAEYCKILATLLNDGKSPTTGKTILSPDSIAKMMKNSIPQFPDYARTAIPDAKPFWTNPLPQLYPQEGDPAQGWGLTFMQTIEPGPTGRGANTVWWAGIINSFWWVDREKGVAGIICGQILPFGDGTVMGTWGACEAAVYSALQA